MWDTYKRNCYYINNLKPYLTSVCCILGGPGGERIIDVVPRVTELEIQLRRGVGQASHTCKNSHIKFTGVH
jgi:hypothetical protein